MTLQPLRDTRNADIPDSMDLRGFDVLARDGGVLGTVAEVIVDALAEAPVYLNILPRDDDGSSSECWIRIPYDDVTVDEGARCVVLSDVALLGLGTGRMTLPGARRL